MVRPSTASGERRQGETIKRVTPIDSQRSTSDVGVDRSAEADLEAVEAATVGLELAPEPVDLRGRRLDRVAHPDPAVTESRGAAQRRNRLTTDQDRRSRSLHRFRLEHDTVEVEVLAVVRDLGLGPQPPAHLDRLVDAAPSAREVELGGDPLLFEPARADAELDPAARDDVERLHGARRDERMPQPDVVDVRAEPHPLGAAGEEREVRERVEDRRLGRHRRMGLARMRRPAHRRGEHEVLG